MNRPTNLQRLAAIAKLYGTFSDREIGLLINTFGKFISIENGIVKACIEDEVIEIPVITTARCKSGQFCWGLRSTSKSVGIAKYGGYCGSCAEEMREQAIADQDQELAA